jgi:hypothetical protein
MDIFIGTGGFHKRIKQLHIAALQEAEGRGLAAYLAPLIDELVHAHHVLLYDAIAVWNLFDDADARLVKKPNRARFLSESVFLRHTAAVYNLEPHSRSGAQPKKTKRQGKWAYDTEPPADSRFTWGPIEGALKELTHRVGQREQWFRDYNGTKIWVQGINSRKFKAWFNSHAMYAKAVEREPPSRNGAKRRETARADKTSRKKAPNKPPSS